MHTDTKLTLPEIQQDIQAVMDSDYPSDMKIRDIMAMLEQYAEDEVYRLRCDLEGQVHRLELRNDDLSEQIVKLRDELTEVKFQRVKHLTHELETLGVRVPSVDDHTLDTFGSATKGYQEKREQQSTDESPE